MKRTLLVLAACGIAGAVWLFGPFLLIIVNVFLSMLHIRSVEAQMQRPENYQPAGRDIALCCQSTGLIENTGWELGYEWLPSSIGRFDPSHVDLKPDGATIGMGGGFHHWGYRLEKNTEASTAQSNVWRLWFYSEDARDKLLQTFSTPPDERISRETFIANAVAAYDKTITAEGSPSSHRRKIAFLLQYDSPSAARKACRQMLQSLPDHYWSNLAVALIDARVDEPGAEAALRRWVEAAPSYSRYQWLACYYWLRDRPTDAAGAIEKAISLPVGDDRDDEYNCEYRGYGLGVYLYRAGQYAVVVRLCDALLPVRENGNYFKPALNALRSAAASSAAGDAGAFVPDARVADFDPFYANGTHVDLQKLLSGTDPSPGSDLQ